MKKTGKSFFIIMIAVTAAILAIMAVSFKTETSAASAIGSVFAPVQKAAAFIVNGISGGIADIKNSSKNARSLKLLKKKNAELSDEVRMLESYKKENEQLRSLLELKKNDTEGNYTAANVIGRDSDGVYYTLTIDKGSRDGIKQDASVIVSEGLVGAVCEVAKNFSKVRTLLDAESSVSVICPRSGDMAIVDGASGQNGLCSMNYIDKDAKIVVGDSVETSGTGGVFPRGILVGKVTAIKNDDRGLTMTAIVETGANPRKIKEVLVGID